jgi:hypothetical protein
MKKIIVFVLLLLLCPIVHAENLKIIASENATVETPLVSALGINYSLSNNSLPKTIPDDKDNQFSEGSGFGSVDAVANAQAQGNVLTLKLLADDVNDKFGGIRGLIYNIITFNIDAENIPIARDYNDMNANLAVILAILFILGESLTVSAATSNYGAYSNVFGEKDFSDKRFVGGGLSMIAGIGATYIFRGIMIVIGMVDAYLMLMVMDSIEPNASNAMIYFFMTVIELVLLLFFLYRQVLIVAMYIMAPVYGVLWASGYAKEFIDKIGDKFIRALIMQPLAIFVTVACIITFKALKLTVLGITVWSGDTEGLFGLFLCALLFYTCKWCLFGEMTIVRRTAKLLITRKVYMH